MIFLIDFGGLITLNDGVQKGYKNGVKKMLSKSVVLCYDVTGQKGSGFEIQFSRLCQGHLV